MVDSTKDDLTSAVRDMEAMKSEAIRSLALYVASKIQEKATRDQITSDMFCDWLAGRSLGYFFKLKDEWDVFVHSEALLLSPGNLGINVVDQLGIQGSLQLRLCTVGKPTRSEGEPVPQYIFLR